MLWCVEALHGGLAENVNREREGPPCCHATRSVRPTFLRGSERRYRHMGPLHHTSPDGLGAARCFMLVFLFARALI